jgi:hypothetical protein
MNESTRQALGAVFIAVADAAGPGVMQTACDTIMRAVDAGGVSDPYAKAALMTLVGSCRPIATASDLAADIFARLEDLDADTPVEDIRAIIGLLDGLDAAVGRLSPATASNVAA